MQWGAVLDLDSRDVIDLGISLKGVPSFLKGFCLARDCVFCKELVRGKKILFMPCCLRARHEECGGEQCQGCRTSKYYSMD